MPDHKEAYCLMRYRTDDKSESETLWNSRDGVTPFTIMNRDKTKRMSHVDWNLDRADQMYIPPPGMRIFVSATEELVRDALKQYIDEFWGTRGARKTFGDKDNAYAQLLPDWLHDGEAPWVVTVPDKPTELSLFYTEYLPLFREHNAKGLKV
jgi:hypothetical protein